MSHITGKASKAAKKAPPKAKKAASPRKKPAQEASPPKQGASDVELSLSDADEDKPQATSSVEDAGHASCLVASCCSFCSDCNQPAPSISLQPSYPSYILSCYQASGTHYTRQTWSSSNAQGTQCAASVVSGRIGRIMCTRQHIVLARTSVMLLQKHSQSFLTLGLFR